MRHKVFFILSVVLTTLSIQSVCAQYFMENPAWAKDLIIYEINTKGFTSPEGPETGTFNSLKEKVSYLHDLGITGVWLTGHSWADHRHFYNIWTQYACIRPDVIDPTLGTPEEFKLMIDEFHKYNIKVFLDGITHGVMNYSPLIKEKPHWFKGGSWGMTDYDWFGNHTDLDEWWVNTFTDFVVKYGVDGYRLDLWMYRPDLWSKIKENSAKADRQIVIFQEAWDYNESYSNGVNDFLQGLVKIGDKNTGLNYQTPLLYNVAEYYHNEPVQPEIFEINRVIVRYFDGTEDTGSRTNRAENRLSFVTETSEGKMRVRIDNINNQKAVQRITLIPTHHSFFPYVAGSISSNIPLPRRSIGYTSPANFLFSVSQITMEIEPLIPDKLFYTTVLSCHDDGWEGFPLTDNPYVAEGSRYLFGYSALFTPSIIVFMSGEEFNADYVPLPSLSPYLFDKKNIGKGKWMYGSWLQWDQLKTKKHAEMLTDVKKMLSIRKQESDLIHAAQNNKIPNIDSLEYSSKDKLPKPFIMWNERKAIFVAGNNNANKDVHLAVKIPLDKIGFGNATKFKITDLWNGTVKEVKVSDLQSFSFSIKKDKIAGGGVAIYKIEILQ